MANVVLIGYRGTGKSSVAELVAATLDYEVVHMDDLICERTGKSIPELVEEKGWDAFFDEESRVAQEVGARDGVVVDTGGGVIRREENMAHLTRNGMVFWLRAAAETIRSRIQDDTNRPSLTGKKSFVEEVDEVLQGREPVYEQYADHVLETDGRTLGDIANDVVEIVCGG
jgi:shikimate kinase